MASAFLLIIHGSRDPRPQSALQQLGQRVAEVWVVRQRSAPAAALVAHHLPAIAQSQKSDAHPCIGLACLEYGPAPLQEQIYQFALQAQASGYDTVRLLPLFLLPGVHVMEDIPAEVALAKQRLTQQGSSLQIHLYPYLGSHPGLVQLLDRGYPDSSSTARVLLSHGSRRPESHPLVASIAAQLQAEVAYWSVAPSLETQVEKLVYAGYQQIVIQPYFLFAGGITDAIAQRVDQLSQQFHKVKLHLMESLGPSADLAELVIDHLGL